MRVYIAGPMTGIPDYNRPAFHAAAERITAAGYHAVNPAEAEVYATDPVYVDYLRDALRWMLSCDGIALLPRWEMSRGARLEVQVGATLGMVVQTVSDWEFSPPETMKLVARELREAS